MEKPVSFAELEIGEKFVVPHFDGTNFAPWVCYVDPSTYLVLTKSGPESVTSSLFRHETFANDREKLKSMRVMRVRV